MGLTTSNHPPRPPTAMYTTSNYFPKGAYTYPAQKPLNQSLRIILCGVYDDNHSLSQFRGMRYLIQSIWQYAGSNDINYTFEAISKYFDMTYYGLASPYFQRYILSCVRTPNTQSLQFPEPSKQETNINMMPILMHPHKLHQQLPARLQGYIPYIKGCLLCDPTQRDKIC